MFFEIAPEFEELFFHLGKDVGVVAETGEGGEVLVGSVEDGEQIESEKQESKCGGECGERNDGEETREQIKDRN